jgi:hypothetical protein
MDKENKEWQDRNVDNIKTLVKKDTQELWSRISMLTQARKLRKEVDLVRA